MDYNASAQFVSSLVKSLHSLCNGFVEFDTWVQVSGTLYMQTDMGKSIEFVIDEKVYKPTEIIVQTLSGEKPKPIAMQDNWSYTPVEQIEPQGNLHDLVQAAAKQSQDQEFQLVFNDEDGENDLYSTSTDHIQVLVKQESVENDTKPPGIISKNFGLKRNKRMYKDKDMYRTYQPGEGPFKCDVCNKGFTRDSTLKVHRRLHTSERPYKCLMCPKRFNTSQDLRTHNRTHSGEKPYKCRVCNERFAQYGTVKRHELTHISAADEKTHICSMCGRGFDRKDALLRHSRIHESESKNKCKTCKQEFATKMDLALHKSTHLKKPKVKDEPFLSESSYVCNICNKWFDKKEKLKGHMKRIHETEQKNMCSVCGLSFDNKIELIIHKSKHPRRSGKMKKEEQDASLEAS